MPDLDSTQPWDRKTIDRAVEISTVLDCLSNTSAVEIYSPAKLCSQCGKSAEILIVPSRLCAECCFLELAKQCCSVYSNPSNGHSSRKPATGNGYKRQARISLGRGARLSQI